MCGVNSGPPILYTIFRKFDVNKRREQLHWTPFLGVLEVSVMDITPFNSVCIVVALPHYSLYLGSSRVFRGEKGEYRALAINIDVICDFINQRNGVLREFSRVRRNGVDEVNFLPISRRNQ